ncbi:MAG: pilus assembly protein PilN [Kangiellaceae bacterium]|jgi:type IV pilus assembly protein PilN|nr:pilus assembly protein PilN [Kangiellaceae bacterium]|tara:strand:- start:46393 stop:46950 length:558 start_codon:yes stop_codon:yes gene_type:complete
MANINLLPWREERRRELQNQYLTQLGVSVVVAALIAFGGFSFVQGQINNQNARNKFLEQEIAVLDKQIKEIQELEKKREELETRMNIIQQLEKSRPEIVRLFDEMVRVMPSEVSVSEISRNQQTLVVKGLAGANTRVAKFMRNLDESEVYGKPDLKFISQQKNDEALNNYELTVSLAKSETDKDE